MSHQPTAVKDAAFFRATLVDDASSVAGFAMWAPLAPRLRLRKPENWQQLAAERTRPARPAAAQTALLNFIEIAHCRLQIPPELDCMSLAEPAPQECLFVRVCSQIFTRAMVRDRLNGFAAKIRIRLSAGKGAHGSEAYRNSRCSVTDCITFRRRRPRLSRSANRRPKTKGAARRPLP